MPQSYKTELTIIGSGTCLPMPGHGAPCNLLSIDGHNLLIDSGAGSTQALVERGVQPDQLTALFYSHFHHDHIGELANLISWFQVRRLYADKIGHEPVTTAITIYGPIGIKNFVQTKALLVSALAELPDNVSIVEIAPGQEITVGKTTVVTHKTKHTDESLGYRFTSASGHVVAISGDTGFDASIVPLIKDADIAVLECSYDDADYEKTKSFFNHLGPTAAGTLAQQANAKTLVLTHLYPCALAINVVGIAKKVFDGTVIMAVDGKQITA
jgi:ribonuclease BN (tRNA processing enzyme)